MSAGAYRVLVELSFERHLTTPDEDDLLEDVPLQQLLDEFLPDFAGVADHERHLRLESRLLRAGHLSVSKIVNEKRR